MNGLTDSWWMYSCKCKFRGFHLYYKHFTPPPAMKVTVLSYNAVAAWKWNTSTEPHKLHVHAERDETGAVEQEDEDEDDVCGICQQAYESTCPACKVPGDDCPLSE
jgi:hypothetical protein